MLKNQTCWLLEHVFSCLAILLEAALRVVRPTLKSLTPSPTRGGNSSQIHTSMFPTFTSIHQNIRWTKCRSSFLWASQEVHCASFFTKIYARLKISKSTSLTRSCLYLEAWELMTSYLQVYKIVTSNKVVSKIIFTWIVFNNEIKVNLRI
jgi:hypothetical protein